MITVAIVALLATIALPSYEAYLQCTRRADARTFLSGLAQQLERCYTQFGSYAAGTGCGVAAGPLASPAGHYRVSIGDRTASTYTLTATPQGVQAGDTKCASFTLNHLGQHTATGSLGNNCWDR